MDQLPSFSSKKSPTHKQIGILGTGQFASALTQRLLSNGYSVVLGSRNPQQSRRRAALSSLIDDTVATGSSSKVRVTSLEDCVTSNDVIIVALHVEHYEEVFTAEMSRLCAEKTLVDVSNGRRRKTITTTTTDGNTAITPTTAATTTATTTTPKTNTNTNTTTKTLTSNAHLLASLAPESNIVKAFNSIPAYVIENDVTASGGGGGTWTVAVASDDVAARAAVGLLARELGFEPHEVGGLEKARGMEEREAKVFPEWTVAVVASLVSLFFWLLFAVGRFYLADSKLQWDQLPLKILNKVFGATTLTLLSLTYFPSTCAACFQMAYGTKHRRFPRWLDVWLKSRKRLGLMAFALSSVHAIISALILSPTYMSAWFPKDVTGAKMTSNMTQDVVLNSGRAWMTWVGELSVLVGVLAYVLMVLLAVTSVPSVTSALHWAEWQFLHSRLGYVMLALAVAHVYVMGFPRWMKTGFPLLLFTVKFQSTVLPTLVLVSRLVLLLPCLRSYLRRIRMGWERKLGDTEQQLLQEGNTTP